MCVSGSPCLSHLQIGLFVQSWTFEKTLLNKLYVNRGILSRIKYVKPKNSLKTGMGPFSGLWKEILCIIIAQEATNLPDVKVS